MILIVQNRTEYENDLRAMVMAFFPGEKLKVVAPPDMALFSRDELTGYHFILTVIYNVESQYQKTTRFRIEEGGHIAYSAYAYGDYTDRKRYRNKFKLAIYRMLSEYTGRDLPWGSLTGMRPTKIATSAYLDGKNREETIEYFTRVYDTSLDKAILATDVAMKERRILASVNPYSEYCLYIGIPFCPTRCLYCSFTAYPIYEFESKVPEYLKALEKELQFISYLNRHRRLVAIYIGGGTPTALSERDLGHLLDAVDDSFDMSNLREYTVEAGRPDSITQGKLTEMKRHGVTRISINPQTMNEFTLRKIGRSHTPTQIVLAMDMARKAGFENVNMDIIAGLPGEAAEDMEYTLDAIERMKPESLTVHSLALKRKARLNTEYDDYRGDINHDVDKMLALAGARARKMGMAPYYLYRQKNIAGNLENVGYAKKGLECIYNVLIMEERLDIYAAGAGSVSRVVTVEDDRTVKVDRVENVSNIDEYISRIDEMLERKRAASEE